jgi:RNA-directed DNA polymerase
MTSVTQFITRKLKLKVNETKSAMARPWECKFLGFSFTNGREPKRRIAPKARQRFKDRVREPGTEVPGRASPLTLKSRKGRPCGCPGRP